MHPGAFQFVEVMLGSLPPRHRVLEIGSRNVNGSIRPLFRGTLYYGIDLVGGWDVDEVANGALFTTRDRYDTVVCCEVLEHTPDAEALVGNALHLLTPDGVLLVTCAAPPRPPHSGIDGGTLKAGEYYRNVRPEELLLWCDMAGGAVHLVSYIPERGDLYLCAKPVPLVT